MRKIYTGIDIGSDSIKIVVAEIKNDNFYVLASTSKKSNGISRGLVVDSDEAEKALKSAVDDIESQIGVRIDKAIVTVPSKNRKLRIVSSTIKLKGENPTVTGSEIARVLEDVVIGAVRDEDELVTTTPIVFNVDDRENIINPKNMEGKKLGVKAVIGVVPKQYLYPYLNLFSDVGIEVIDIAFGSIGDYALASNKAIDRELGAIINIGEETINISIFNKTILIKNEIIKLGSKNVDKDLLYMYGVDLEQARFLKENFALSMSKDADANDTIELELNSGEILTLNQKDVTRIVEARIVELLKLAKKEINNLTNRKISYIIVTGGITGLTGFSTVLEKALGMEAYVLNANIMGIRNNKFSSAAGIIKYYDKKMDLIEKKYSMFSKEQVNTMMAFSNGNMVPLDEGTSTNDNYVNNN